MQDIFDWSLIDIVQTGGKKEKQTTCPVCSAGRKKKKDKCLSVNFEKGTAYCHHCNAISFKEDIETETKKDYQLPIQTWSNFTKLSDKVVKYFEGRKIHQNTLNNFNITEELYFQPALNKNVSNVVFNYFEGNTLINKKYRSGGKKFTQSAGTKKIFYNINSVVGKKQCYIVEGEVDVLSMYEVGIKNCISLPNGANDTDDFWKNAEKYLKNIELFYIATDNDEKGNEVAEKIAQRLGRWRCKRIIFKNKDANDDLISGDLEDSIKNATNYPVSGTFKVSDLYNGILDLYDNGLPEKIYPKHRCFGSLKNVFSVMRGHLVTGTGIPSHGKSNFVEWYVLNLIKDYKMKASFFSPEHSPMELHKTTFIQKAFGKNFWKEMNGTPRITKDEIKQYRDWADEKIYLTSAEKNQYPDWDWLLDKFKEQMFNFGIDIFVIDAFNKLDFKEKGNRLENINKILTKLTMFAQMNNVIIFLIAHPTKMKKNEDNTYSIPTLYDVSGSSDFRNQTHDGFTIHRYFDDDGVDGYTEFINTKVKMSFQGEIGAKVEFSYHMPSGRYYPKYGEVPTFNLINDEEQNNNKEIKRLETVEPEEAFFNDDIAF